MSAVSYWESSASQITIFPIVVHLATFAARTQAYWIYGPEFPSNESALSQPNTTFLSRSCERYEYLIAAMAISRISSSDRVLSFSSRIAFVLINPSSTSASSRIIFHFLVLIAHSGSTSAPLYAWKNSTFSVSSGHACFAIQNACLR